MATNLEIPDWECSDKPPKSSVFRKSNPFRTLTAPLSAFNRRSTALSPTGTNLKDASPHNSDVTLPPANRSFEKETQANADEAAPVADGIVENRKPTIFGLNRIKFLLICAFVVVAIALIIGLAVGLTKKSSSHATPQNLPLPSNKATFTGDLTFYSPGPGYGACGYMNTSTEAICALSYILFKAASPDPNGNNNPLCGKKIRITRYDATRGGNSSVDVEVVDRCTGCDAQDVDLSLKMFTTLADESLGRVTGSWAWLD